MGYEYINRYYFFVKITLCQTELAFRTGGTFALNAAVALLLSPFWLTHSSADYLTCWWIACIARYQGTRG